jgi:hypothetical protein
MRKSNKTKDPTTRLACYQEFSKCKGPCKEATTITQTPGRVEKSSLFQSASQDEPHYHLPLMCYRATCDNKPKTDQPCKWP